MIISKQIKIVISRKNIKHFQQLGYNIKFKDEISVPIEHLTKGSHHRIDLECDVCKKHTKLSFKDYNKNINKHNIYSCSNKCSMNKFKLSCIEKYGVDNISKLSEVKNKVKYSVQEKYGVNNVMLVPDFNLKMRNSQRDTIAKNGDEIIKKRKNTMIEKYGVDAPMKSKTIQKKQMETLLKNFNVTNPSKSNIIKQKKIKTTMRNWGVDNPLKNNLILEKLKQTKIKNGNQISDAELTAWQKYKKEVTIITNKNKKLLFKNWDGFDYYDNEKIAEYLQYDHTTPYYPTIDHKVSIYYGFKHNIDPEIICSIENLCITKRSINSIKNKKTEFEFINNYKL
jgi:hypothetical protein